MEGNKVLDRDLCEEEKDDGIVEMMDEEVIETEEEVAMDDESQVEESTKADQSNVKKSRSRTSVEDFPELPKRRKILSDSEILEDPNRVNDAEPIAGCSSHIYSKDHEVGQQRQLGPSTHAEHQDFQAYGRKYRTHNDQRMLQSLEDVPLRYRASGNPSTPLTTGIEELFRLPIYEESEKFRGFRASHSNTDMRNNTSSDPPMNQEKCNKTTDKETRDLVMRNETQRMIWARKLLFSTTDAIFPGFKMVATDKANRQSLTTIVRSSWVLQAVLYADTLFFLMWMLSFLSNVDISVSVLKELHGNLILCMTALFITVNVPRLFLGLRGNDRDMFQLLALFWMTTVIVQTPLFGFILFTDIFQPIRLPFTIAMDSVMMVMMILECIVGTHHIKNLIRDELRVIQVSKLSEANPVVHDQLNEGIDDQNDRENQPPVNDKITASDNDEEWSTDEEEAEDEFPMYRGEIGDLGYRMRFPRGVIPDAIENYMEEEEQDVRDDNDNDSDIVSSTSDLVRHRPVRVN